MLPREFLRESAERLLREMPERFTGSGIEEFAELDRLRRETVTKLEEKRRRRNELTSVRGRPSPEGLAEMKALKEEIKELEGEEEKTSAGLAAVEARIPNVPHDSVPRGKDETANRVERTWGTPPSFSFEPRAHWDLGPALGILDFDRGAKLAGARFTVLTGAGARLSRALIAFMLDLHTREHGYTEVSPPVMANADSLFTAGQLPKFEEDLFRMREGYYLIPTAEVPLTNLHRDEILSPGALPIRYAAYTPCFRAEAGAAGRDTRGMIRQHQFDKIEIMTFASPDDSYEHLERLTGHAEEVLKRLRPSLPRRRRSRRATSGSAPRRRTTWKSGCRGRTPTGRSPPARTSRRSRRAAARSASAAPREKNPSSCTPSTARRWRSAARWSRSSKTSSARTARSRSRKRCAHTSAPLKYATKVSPLSRQDDPDRAARSSRPRRPSSSPARESSRDIALSPRERPGESRSSD